MKFVLFFMLALVLAQRDRWFDPLIGTTIYRIDIIHGHAVQYDDDHDLLLLVGRVDCYLIDASPDTTWDQIAHSQTLIPEITEAIYHQIISGTGVTRMTHSEAERQFHSHLETWECRGKDVYHLLYTPPTTD